MTLKMKNFFYIMSILLTLCSTANADISRDLTPYNIIDESNYAILIYDLKNSLVQQFGDGKEVDGKIRTSLVLGNLDLIKIKKEIILNMQFAKLMFPLNFLFADCSNHYKDQLMCHFLKFVRLIYSFLSP